MNRTIALLIPAILLMAMALIIFQQFHSSSSEEELVLQSANPARTEGGSAGAPSQLPGTGAPAQPPLPGLQAQPEKPAQEPALKPETPVQQALQDPVKPAKNKPEQQQAASAAAEASSVSQPPAGVPEVKAPSQTEQKPAPKEEKKPEARAEQKPEQKPDQKPEQKSEQKPETKPEKPAAEQAVTGGTHKMQSIKFEYQGSDMLLVMNADSQFEYKSFQLASPERLVVDVIGTWSGVDLPSVPSNRLIKGVRGGKTDRGYRIVLDLKETPKGYETKRDANKVTIRVY